MKPTELSLLETSPPTPQTSSCIGALPRVFWVAFGGFALVVCAVKLILEYPQSLVLLTACVFLLAALMTAARYADIQFFNGQTCDGDPSTMAHLRAYALRTAVLAPALYIGAILLGQVLRT